jgi:hypothetical protein
MNTDRWEYKVISVKPAWKPFISANYDELLGEALNREGAQGWELAAMHPFGMQLLLVLKRRR